MESEAIFSRMRLMMGDEFAARMRSLRVAIFGVGGVGGWCAESLARSGVGQFLLVDPDRVNATNINRQIVAMVDTIGRLKVDVMAERIGSINPNATVKRRAEVYSQENANSFDLTEYDYVIDAIDSLDDKATLIRHALSIPSVTLFSSMGAAVKTDPSRIRTTGFRKVEGDALARALRHKFKVTGGLPERGFSCVWSDEHRENLGTSADEDLSSGSTRKACINGTVAHAVAIFGFTLASLVVNDILESK